MTQNARQLKEVWRHRLDVELAEAESEGGNLHWGRAAAWVRKSTLYQGARHLLAPPSSHFFQVRLDALMDRKQLTVPSPGMQKGFQHFDPNRMAQRDFIAAARLQKSGERLTRASYGSPLRPPIDLVLGEALCGAEDGGLVGDGRGHLDLSCAILRALGWLDGRARILAVVGKRSVVPVCPQEDHDVKAHGIITPDGFFRTAEDRAPGKEIQWEKLGVRQIRRNEVLFFIASRDRRSFG
ncbi:MAG: 5-formyltetrahydrofolate cyclo-ligase [Syntrophobacteraceae bacterium]|nr:5-formyltetrahydrofolate cyclo-ligase [Syntrophobacteraceae bacterium]